MSALTATSRKRAWTALGVGLVAILTIPAAIEVANRSKRVELLDAAYVIPVAFVLAVISLGMANRARKNLRWLQLREDGTGVATVVVLIYQHSR
jgi:ABC-type sugar transport system permease subunit